jgi:hypothetical protein
MALRRKAATLTVVLGMMAAASAGAQEATGTSDQTDPVDGSSRRISLVFSRDGGELIVLETRRPRPIVDEDPPLPPAA